MKKLISLLLCISLMTSLSVFAQSQYEGAISRVSGIGIMGNVADGDFRPDDNITRAEFTAVALRMLGIFSSPQSSTMFSDVPFEHWASGHVSTASDMGLINGRGDGIFAPEDSVTYPEAVKIMVCALGREAAMTSKDYPGSYLAMGGSIGLTKGVEFGNEPLTRAEVAALVDNALDIYPLEPVYGSDKYELSSETLFQKLSRIRDTQVYSGILTESGNISLDFARESADGYIKVDDKLFRSAKSYDEYIGQKVDVYYTVSGSTKTVTSIAPEAGTNKIYTLQAADTKYSDDKITYIDSNDKEKSYKLDSDAAVLLNGDRITPPRSFEIHLGEYTLIDNNNNGTIDVVSVTRAESFVVKSVSEANNAIYFDNNRTYHGRNGFAADFDDDEKEYVIEGSDGSEISFESINAGDAVSIIGNSDDSFVRLIISQERAEGSVSGISSDKITIGESTYPIGKDTNGNPLFSPYLGMEGVFAVDAFGYAIGTFGAAPDKFSYGYISDATQTGSMDSRLKISIITGSEPKKNVKVTNGDETISYYLQNNDAMVFTLASSVKFGDNPVDAQGVKRNSDDILPEMLKGKVAGYTLNSDGEINAINVYSLPSSFSSYEFNAEIFSFGGIKATRGFIKDDNTQVVCVPNAVRDDDDYGVRVTITDESSYKVYGVNGITENEYGSEEANAEPMDIIIVKADMDSSLPPVIPMDDDICIVGKVSTKFNEDQDEVCVIELLNGSEKETYEVPSDSLAYSQAKKLLKGDLIQFTTNSLNEIASIRYKASVQGLADYTGDDNIYGMVEDIKYNVYDYFSNQMVDKIYVNVGNDILNVKLFKSDGQNMYLYDRKSGYIYPAESEDIKAASYYGNDATKLFAIVEDNDAQVIVLIKD